MKFLKILSLAALIATSISAQSTFKNEYGDSSDHGNFKSIVSDSSGYLISGTKLRLIPNVVAIAVKTDLEGRIVWQRNFGDTTSRFGFASCTKMANGNYMLYTFDQILQKSHLYYLDASGNIIYQKEILNFIILNLFEMNPNEIVIAGNLSSGFSIIALDSSLNTSWAKSYGVSESVSAYRISPANDNSFIVLHSHPSTGYNFITKIDSAGSIIWAKQFSSINYYQGFVTETVNGDLFLISGVTINKMDHVGNLIWSKNLSGFYEYEVPRSLISTPDGGCLILGYVKNLNTTFATLVVKADSSGNIVWSQTSGSYSDMSDPVEIINTTDSAYALLCNTWGRGHILFKMDSVGFAGCPGTPYPMIVQPITTSITDDSLSTDTMSVQFANVSVPFDTLSFTMNQICFVNKVDEIVSNPLTIFPSPFSDKLTVHDTKSGGQIKMFDVTGRIVTDLKSMSGETEVITSFLGKGFYVIRYEEEGRTFSTKAVKY